jgi:tetratricopeptide (TPR) repeat protein
VLIGLLATLALAAPPDETQQAADAHFHRGLTLATQGDCARAISEFEEAYRLAPAWQLLFNIGIVREKLGEPALALEAFGRYLDQGGQAVPPDKRQQVERELAALRKEVAELVVNVDGDAAAVEVDGQERTTSPIYVLPGRHRVTARRDAQTAHADVEVQKGERAVVALALSPAPKVPEPAPAAALVPTPEPSAQAPLAAALTSVQAVETSRPWYQRWYVWTIVGAVVVAGAVTSIAVVETRSRFDVRVDTP